MMMYWTFDIPSNFMVGFHKADGEVVFGIKRIACRYSVVHELMPAAAYWLTTGMKLFTGSEGCLAWLSETLTGITVRTSSSGWKTNECKDQSLRCHVSFAALRDWQDVQD
eukprot:6485537-Amphidinium_carterae.2